MSPRPYVTLGEMPGRISGDVGPKSVIVPVPRSYSARINQPVAGLMSSLRVSMLARSVPTWNRPASITGFARQALPFPKIENTVRVLAEAHRSSLQSAETLLRALMLNLAVALAP